jgi:hypothetical protein
VLNPVSAGVMNFSPLYSISGATKFSPAGITATTVPTYTHINVTNSDSIVFYVMAPSYASDAKALLPSAQYKVELSNTVAPNMVLSHEVHKIFNSPTIACTEVDQGSYKDGTLPYISTHRTSFTFQCSSYKHDSTTVNVFYTKKKSEPGVLIGSGPMKALCDNCEDDNVTVSLNNLKLPEKLYPQDSIYFYASIDDGVNSVKTADINILKYFKNYITIGGKVQIENQPDSLASGIEVSMWRYCSWVDPMGVNHPLDYYKLNQERNYTSNQGTFGFQFITNSDPFRVKIDIPVGYEVHPNSPYKPDKDYIITNQWNPLNMNVLLRKIKSS